MAPTAKAGLEDVVAAESAITWIDGEKGELRYRGYPVGELAERCSFEEVAYLLWRGELPDEPQLRALRSALQRYRSTHADRFLALVDASPAGGHPLDLLRYVLSYDALDNPLSWDGSGDANREKALQFTAWFPMVVAAFHRKRKGLPPVRPQEGLDTAAVFLQMLYGAEASQVAVETLDTSLVLHADHELNASTFAARVTIATQSNLHAAIASALGTLAGPRHGGASDRIITMLEEIRSPSNVEAYVLNELAQKRRIMGFGHRVYRTIDPRSRHLRQEAERMLAGTAHEPWAEILQRLGAVMERERRLYPNVDLYAAVVNHELGILPDFYTSIFAVSRITGWTAHAMEQLGGRMIRPVAGYVGPEPRSLMSVSTV